MKALSREEGMKLLAKGGKPSKYRNKPTVVDGIRFASKREAAFYVELKQREKAGEVYEVQLQRRYALTGPTGMLFTTYVCDFAFHDATLGRNRVIDIKGVETEAFKIKRKAMQAILGIEVEVIK